MLLGCLGKRWPWTPGSKLPRCPRGSPQNFQGVLLIGPKGNEQWMEIQEILALGYLCGSGSLPSTSSSIKWEERVVNLKFFFNSRSLSFWDPKDSLQKWWNSIWIIKEILLKQKLTSNSDLKKTVVFLSHVIIWYSPVSWLNIQSLGILISLWDLGRFL